MTRKTIALLLHWPCWEFAENSPSGDLYDDAIMPVLVEIFRCKFGLDEVPGGDAALSPRDGTGGRGETAVGLGMVTAVLGPLGLFGTGGIGRFFFAAPGGAPGPKKNYKLIFAAIQRNPLTPIGFCASCANLIVQPIIVRLFLICFFNRSYWRIFSFLNMTTYHQLDLPCVVAMAVLVVQHLEKMSTAPRLHRCFDVNTEVLYCLILVRYLHGVASRDGCALRFRCYWRMKRWNCRKIALRDWSARLKKN